MAAHDPTRSIHWPHGQAELQRLAAMLAPVVFRAPGHPDFSPMHVAPWADEATACKLPGILQRLRGEWPCVPFGRTDRPKGLPASWAAVVADDECGHGHASHHEWDWLSDAEPGSFGLTIRYPDQSRIERLTRIVRAVPDSPALNIVLRIEARESCVLPVALHPTLRLDLGRVELDLAHAGPGLTYPVREVSEGSRLAPDREFSELRHVPGMDGHPVDLTVFPQAIDSEDLVQLCGITGPIGLNYVDQGWRLELDWDRSLLPDAMLWISHRGRQHAPWSGRHLAIGVEPVNGAFDLGRIAVPPAGHPLALRGIALQPGVPCEIRYRIGARPL